MRAGSADAEDRRRPAAARRFRRPGQPASRIPGKRRRCPRRPAGPSAARLALAQLRAGRQPARAADLLPTVSAPEGRRRHQGPRREILGQRRHRHRHHDGAAAAEPRTVRLHAGLQLAYDSGSGNGPFGFGWSLGLPAITRKTDKGLPLYCDGDESDVFILAGAEDLVPVLDAAGGRKTLTRTVYGAPIQIAFYRPRIEGLFSRIERWTATDTGVSHWRTISRDNVTTLYGADPASRIADPADPAQIFSWHICRTWDDKGNAAIYSYAAEDSAGIDLAAAHEANRTAAGRAAQTYLKTIQYGNLQPYFPDWTAPQETRAPDRLDVLAWSSTTATTRAMPPAPQPDQPWPLRPDPFSTYRAGFEVRTYRRVQRLLFFNNFPGEPTAGADCLVRSLDLVYSDQQAPADPRNPIYTFLVSVTQTGYRPGRRRASPPGRCRRSSSSYSQPQIQPAVLTLDPDSQANLPEGLDGGTLPVGRPRRRGPVRHPQPTPAEPGTTSGTSAPATWSRSPTGRSAARASFGPLETVAAPAVPRRPVRRSGCSTWPAAAASTWSTWPARTRASSSGPKTRPSSRCSGSPRCPALDWSDPNVTFIDVTGDGLADILMTEDGLFTVLRLAGRRRGLRRRAAGPARLGRGKGPQRRARRRHRRPSSPPTCRATA